MKDPNKTEGELINELGELRQRVAELEAKVKEYGDAEEILREYQKVIESSQDMIVVVDQHCKYVLANAEFLKYRGLDREQVIGRSVQEILGKDVFEKVVKKHLDTCFRGEAVQYEMKYVYPKLGERDLLVQYFPIENPEGINRVVSVIQDITERKRMEEALGKSKEKFRELYDHAPLGYHEYDAEGRITNVNHTDLEMLGYTAEEMIGQPIWKFNIEEEVAREQVMAKLAGALPPGKELERTYRRKDGTTFPVLIEDRLIRDGEGRIKGIRCTIQNITDRKRAEEDREKLIHELRDALASIKRLRGLLPICASCKKIRDDKGYWNQIESYIRDHTEAEFTHGICPECMKKLYPDLYGRDPQAGIAEGRGKP
jgi:sigma-B regulation protein RsbU (phosphoserine phosphatase)